MFKNNFKYLLLIHLVACLAVSSSQLSWAQNPPSQVKAETVDPIQKSNAAIERRLNNVRHEANVHKEQTDSKIELLETTLQSQKDTIKSLELEIKLLREKPITNGSTFEVWSGILLGCVSVIVTVLGVGVAFMALIGFRNVRIESKEISEQTATKIANQITPKVAEKKLMDHVKKGGFNKIIEEAVDKVALSNINDPENYTEQPTDGTV